MAKTLEQLRIEGLLDKPLQQLRKEAGYKSAKDFVESLMAKSRTLPLFEDEFEPVPDDFSISLSTYTRYEKDPSNMPLSTAKVLADQLDCSIDVIAGRDHIDVDEMRGDVQKRFDALPTESQQSVLDFIEFVEDKAEREAARKIAEKEREYERMASFYERMLFAAADSDSELADKLMSGTEKDMTWAFYEFVYRKLKEKRERELLEATLDFDAEIRSSDQFAFVKDDHALYILDPEDDDYEESVAIAVEEKRAQRTVEMERRDMEVMTEIMNAYARLHSQTNICYSLVNVGSDDEMPQLQMDHITPLSVVWSNSRRE